MAKDLPQDLVPAFPFLLNRVAGGPEAAYNNELRKRAMASQWETRPYRVGIVGTGGIAYAHGTACAELECAELCAICDVSEAALNRCGDEFDVANRYLDLSDMLVKENLDIVIICTWGSASCPSRHSDSAITKGQGHPL